ncbi:hypothetical protein [Spirulina subsalsa]|uniref:hypothetical protein n=1 Tax=Spirulina subsalsa TaxID=54311 RepID=UPI0008FB130B|nr:hypothetical protein [Spirulina subsalsa]
MDYIPLSTDSLLLAAQLWAQARQTGQPTADPKALDGDVILSAQARLLASEKTKVVVATTNVGHLSRFVNAEHWQSID